MTVLLSYITIQDWQLNKNKTNKSTINLLYFYAMCYTIKENKRKVDYIIMFDQVQKHESSEGNVWKFVFIKEDAVTEAVLYKYDTFKDRTVICCSVQSGCPVGCLFCGTGKKFIRNLTYGEIVYQVSQVIDGMGIIEDVLSSKKFQIMFMSMGEPMLNWDNVELAIEILHDLYPNAQLLISTVGINDDNTFRRMINISKKINKVGLQFSIHKASDDERDVLIPFKNKMSLRRI